MAVLCPFERSKHDRERYRRNPKVRAQKLAAAQASKLRRAIEAARKELQQFNRLPFAA